MQGESTVIEPEFPVRTFTWAATALAALLVLSGCAQEAEDKVGEAGQDPAEAWEDARDQAAESMAALGQTWDEEKAAVAELARARDRLAEAEGEAVEEWQQVVDGLEERRDKAMAEFRALEDAGADAWVDMKHGVMEAYNDLRDATEQAASEFDDS